MQTGQGIAGETAAEVVAQGRGLAHAARSKLATGLFAGLGAE